MFSIFQKRAVVRAVPHNDSSPTPILGPSAAAAPVRKPATPAAPPGLYVLPGHRNDPPHCPMHDFYPPSAKHVARFGPSPCLCEDSEDEEDVKPCLGLLDVDAGLLEDEGEDRKHDIGSRRSAVRAGKRKAVEDTSDSETEEENEGGYPRVNNRARKPAPNLAIRGPPRQPAPGKTPPNTDLVQSTPAGIDGDHKFFAPAKPAGRKLFGGWAWRTSSSRLVKGSSDLRYTRYICSGHLLCASCHNVTRPQSTVKRIKAQKLKACSLCNDEKGIYNVECGARAIRTQTRKEGVVKMEFIGSHSCTRKYGGGVLAKGEEDDNVGMWAYQKAQGFQFAPWH